MRFCLCIFESDTVKSDCPIHDEIFKDLIQTVGFNTLLVLLFFLEIFKKKSSENDTPPPPEP